MSSSRRRSPAPSRLDQAGTGVLSPSNAGVGGENVFLDLDNDHQDQDVTTLAGVHRHGAGDRPARFLSRCRSCRR